MLNDQKSVFSATTANTLDHQSGKQWVQITNACGSVLQNYQYHSFPNPKLISIIPMCAKVPFSNWSKPAMAGNPSSGVWELEQYLMTAQLFIPIPVPDSHAPIWFHSKPPLAKTAQTVLRYP
jgi:hypothetical protein